MWRVDMPWKRRVRKNEKEGWVCLQAIEGYEETAQLLAKAGGGTEGFSLERKCLQHSASGRFVKKPVPEEADRGRVSTHPSQLPTLAPRQLSKSFFMSDTATLSWGLLGPLQQGTTVFKSNSTTCPARRKGTMELALHPQRKHTAMPGSSHHNNKDTQTGAPLSQPGKPGPLFNTEGMSFQRSRRALWQHATGRSLARSQKDQGALYGCCGLPLGPLYKAAHTSF